MSYYDYAAAMAFKLDRWAEKPNRKNYEQEAMAAEQNTPFEPVHEPKRFQSWARMVRAVKTRVLRENQRWR